jgi:hypothetical protein
LLTFIKVYRIGGSIVKIIFVEGIPGSGKSTTARFIALQSERNGIKTELFHESTYPHPILIRDPISNHKDWMKLYFSNWDKFIIEQSNNQKTVVMESALFQIPILHLLHMDIDREIIVQFIVDIYSKLTNFNCGLVYLYQDNRMMKTRGGINWLENTYEKYKHEPYYVNRGQHSPNIHLDFLSEYAEVARSAYSKCSLNSLEIENTNWEWTTYHNRILDYLGWLYKPDPIVPLSELQKYVGIYHNDELNLDINIEIKDSQLIIFRDQQLKSKEAHRFYIDNISIVVNFLKGHSGDFNQLIIEEKDLVGNQRDEGTSFLRAD